LNARVLYRIASVLLILFALGHTVGFLKFKPPTAEGIAVHDAMDRVHFQVRGRDYSYGGWYVGFGLFNSIFLLYGAFVAWRLGELVAHDPRTAGALGWGLCAVMLGTLALCWAYFNLVAVAFSAILLVCLGWSASLGHRQAGAAPVGSGAAR
jgi:hypothetical protein